MTREQLFDICAQFGLKLDVERVTTGDTKGPAFRTLEFTGDPQACSLAAKRIRHEWGVSADFCCARLSDGDYKPYLEVSSFWCEPAQQTAGA